MEGGNLGSLGRDVMITIFSYTSGIYVILSSVCKYWKQICEGNKSRYSNFEYPKSEVKKKLSSWLFSTCQDENAGLINAVICIHDLMTFTSSFDFSRPSAYKPPISIFIKYDSSACLARYMQETDIGVSGEDLIESLKVFSPKCLFLILACLNYKKRPNLAIAREIIKCIGKESSKILEKMINLVGIDKELSRNVLFFILCYDSDFFYKEKLHCFLIPEVGLRMDIYPLIEECNNINKKEIKEKLDSVLFSKDRSDTNETCFRLELLSIDHGKIFRKCLNANNENTNKKDG